mgnify:CR=1 FL=1
MNKSISILIFLSLCLCATNEQYDYGKIHLKSGHIIIGENLIYDNNKVAIDIDKETKYIKLNKVKTILSGKRKSFNLFGAFTGFASCLTTLIIIGGDFTDTDILLISPAPIISTGVGILMGFITPHLIEAIVGDRTQWELVYSI